MTQPKCFPSFVGGSVVFLSATVLSWQVKAVQPLLEGSKSGKCTTVLVLSSCFHRLWHLGWAEESMNNLHGIHNAYTLDAWRVV
jgi:hypothetical protein